MISAKGVGGGGGGGTPLTEKIRWVVFERFPNLQFKENGEWMSWEIILLLFVVVQPALENNFASFYQLSTARQL